MSVQYVLIVSIIRVYQEYFFLKKMNSLRQKKKWEQPLSFSEVAVIFVPNLTLEIICR